MLPDYSSWKRLSRKTQFRILVRFSLDIMRRQKPRKKGRRISSQHYHMIGDRRRDRARLTPRLMFILTGCMAVVSGISWIAADIEPLSLYIIPLFVAYCFVLWNIRIHLKPARAALHRKGR